MLASSSETRVSPTIIAVTVAVVLAVRVCVDISPYAGTHPPPRYSRRTTYLLLTGIMLLEDRPLRQRLALPGVTALISFLAFTSQSLFANIEPEPLRRGEAYIFNLLVTCLLICYGRTCLTDPGRIPKDWHERFQNHLSTSTTITSSSSSWEVAAKAMVRSNRWCRRCEAFKPPRAHHCKTCQR